MAQTETGSSYEIHMLFSTYRYPSQTWFSRRAISILCIGIIGAFAGWYLNPDVGSAILLGSVVLGFYVLEKGYRLGRDDHTQQSENIPIDATIEETISRLRRSYKRMLAQSVLLMAGPWFLLLLAYLGYDDGWVMTVLAITILTTFFVGIDRLEQALSCRKEYRKLSNPSRRLTG